MSGGRRLSRDESEDNQGGTGGADAAATATAVPRPPPPSSSSPLAPSSRRLGAPANGQAALQGLSLASLRAKEDLEDGPEQQEAEEEEHALSHVNGADAAPHPSTASSQQPDDHRDPLDPDGFRGVRLYKNYRAPHARQQQQQQQQRQPQQQQQQSPSAAAEASSPPGPLLFTATARWKNRYVVVGTAHPTAAAAAVARDRALLALAGREALLGTAETPRRVDKPHRLNFPASNYPEDRNHLREGRELEAFLESLRAGASRARGGPAVLAASRRARRCGECAHCVMPWLKKKCLRGRSGSGGRGGGGASTSPRAATTTKATTKPKAKTASTPAAARPRDRRPAFAADAQQPPPLSAAKVAHRELELRNEAAAMAALLSAERGGGAASGGITSGNGSDSVGCFYRSGPSRQSPGTHYQQHQQLQLVVHSSRGGEGGGGSSTSNRGTSFDFRAFLGAVSKSSSGGGGRFSFVALPRSGAHAPQRCALCREVGAHHAGGGAGGRRAGRCPMASFLEEEEEGRGGGGRRAGGSGGEESGDAVPAAATAPSLPEAIAALATAVRASQKSGSAPSKRRKVYK